MLYIGVRGEQFSCNHLLRTKICILNTKTGLENDFFAQIENDCRTLDLLLINTIKKTLLHRKSEISLQNRRIY